MKFILSRNIHLRKQQTLHKWANTFRCKRYNYKTDKIILKEVIAMYNGDEEDSYFIVTHKEQEMLNQLRELSDEDRAEVTRRFLEIALKYAEWGE